MNVEQLNIERKKQKISVAELAEKAGLPKGTVEKILFGVVKNPRIDTMQAIERALGLDNRAREENAGTELTQSEETLLQYFRTLSPELQRAALDTVRVLAGIPAGGLQKKA